MLPIYENVILVNVLLGFNTRDLTAITLSAALWAVLNVTITPIFWNLTHLPILCDMIGVALLSLTLWWTRKPGAPTIMGLIATLLNFIMRPGALHFLGFTAACIVFDGLTILMGYDRVLQNNMKGWGLQLLSSIIATAIAGFIIGTFFMNPNFLASAFGGIILFAGIHAMGGAIGGILGIVFIKTLEARNILAR